VQVLSGAKEGAGEHIQGLSRCHPEGPGISCS